MTDEIQLNVTIEVRCAQCDSSLSFEANQHNEFKVDPCETCAKDDYDRAYDEGYEKGASDTTDEFNSRASEEDHNDDR